MKIKLHLPATPITKIPPAINIEENEGIIVLEYPPQIRTLLTENYNNQITLKAKFPYTIFTIKYFIINNKYLYAGQPFLSLHVNICNKPLQSLQDIVYSSPTERFIKGRGLVCTGHKYDNKQFNTLKELTDFVLYLFWNSYHPIDNWQNSLKNVEKFPLKYGEILHQTYNHRLKYDFYLLNKKNHFLAKHPKMKIKKSTK